MCLFIVKKSKEKENQKKRNIKSRKIDKRKRKMLVFKCTITFSLYAVPLPVALVTYFRDHT